MALMHLFPFFLFISFLAFPYLEHFLEGDCMGKVGVGKQIK